MEIFLVVVQLLIVFGALWLGSRYGSLALGAISGIGLALLVFGFGMKPGTPPTDVIYIIIAAITCAGMMQASGGMDWLIQLTEKLLRRNPEMITFLAPLSTFLLTVLVGTGHVVYTLMPIICDISLKKGIRPERPCAVASIASQMGIMASPISAAVVAFVSISNMNGFDVTIPQVLMVSLPACLIGLLAASLCSFKRGKDLDKDPDFQARLKDPEQYNYIYGHSATTLDKEIPLKSKSAVYVFAASLLLIVMFAIFPQLLPSWNGEQLKMNIVIQIDIARYCICVGYADASVLLTDKADTDGLICFQRISIGLGRPRLCRPGHPIGRIGPQRPPVPAFFSAAGNSAGILGLNAFHNCAEFCAVYPILVIKGTDKISRG